MAKLKITIVNLEMDIEGDAQRVGQIVRGIVAAVGAPAEPPKPPDPPPKRSRKKDPPVFEP